MKKTKKDSDLISARRRPKPKRLFLFLVIVFLLLLFGNGVWRGYRFFEFARRPISEVSEVLNQETIKNNLWDGKKKINIAVVSDPILVISVDQEEDLIKILAIPSDTYTEIPDGYGWYRIGAAYGLGELEDSPVGGLLFKKAVTQMVGVPIDYYLASPTIGLFELDYEKISKLKKEFLGFGSQIKFIRAPGWISDNLDTNMTLFDIYRGWWQAYGFSFLEENYLDLSEEYLEEIILADGSRGFIPKAGNFEILVEKIFLDPKIANDGLTVSVQNATLQSGLGESVERLIGNLGGLVVEVKSAQAIEMKSKLVLAGDVDEKSYTVDRLVSVFGLVVEKSEKNLDSDLVLILGEDWLEF